MANWTEDELAELLKTNHDVKPQGDYNRARGVLPYQPGDLLPEEAIASLRGRPVSKKQAPVSVPDESEAEFQAALIELLHTYAYKVCEFRKAARLKKDGTVTYRTPFGADGVGMPDLYVAHPESGVNFWVECKSNTGKVSLAQWQWHETIRKCGEIVFVWRPGEWDAIVDIVKGLAGVK